MPAQKKHANSAARQRAYRRRQQAANSMGPGIPHPAAIRAMPSHSRWKALQDKAAVLLAAVISEMEDYQEDRSEQWQESEKAIAFEDRIDLVREALEAVQAIT